MAEKSRIRVLVVDDHPLVRDSLRRVLENSGEFEVAGEAANGDEAVQLAQDLRPDAVIMHLMIPGKDGVAACREIVDLLPDTRVLMLTASTEDEAVIAAVAAGATGYVVKDASLVELLESLRDVAMGRARIPLPALRRACALAYGQSEPADGQKPDVLTEMEREVLTMFASGYSYADIAGQQSFHGPQRPVPHPGQAGGGHPPGPGCLGRPQWAPGRLLRPSWFRARTLAGSFDSPVGWCLRRGFSLAGYCR